MDGAHQEGAAEVGLVAVVVDSRVDPQHVAGAQQAVGGTRRESDVAVGGPGAIGESLGHHLPDRVDAVGGRAQLEDAREEDGGQIRLAQARSELCLHVAHGALVDRLGAADALDLSRGLAQLDGANQCGGVEGWHVE